MAFRTLEITRPTEIHIKNNQLELTQEGNQFYISIEDLSTITAIGPNIRFSTMDMSILARNHVAITTLDNSYYPTALVLPFEGNARQSQLESTFNTITKGSTEGVMILLTADSTMAMPLYGAPSRVLLCPSDVIQHLAFTIIIN